MSFRSQTRYARESKREGKRDRREGQRKRERGRGEGGEGVSTALRRRESCGNILNIKLKSDI